MSIDDPNEKVSIEAGSRSVQMKVFLNRREHAVVSTASNMKGMKIGEYLRKAIIDQAKIDARDFIKMIEEL
jgi:hypothetical protein